jgi:hypothetical protein
MPGVEAEATRPPHRLDNSRINRIARHAMAQIDWELRAADLPSSPTAFHDLTRLQSALLLLLERAACLRSRT